MTKLPQGMDVFGRKADILAFVCLQEKGKLRKEIYEKFGDGSSANITVYYAIKFLEGRKMIKRIPENRQIRYVKTEYGGRVNRTVNKLIESLKG